MDYNLPWFGLALQILSSDNACNIKGHVINNKHLARFSCAGDWRKTDYCSHRHAPAWTTWTFPWRNSNFIPLITKIHHLCVFGSSSSRANATPTVPGRRRMGHSQPSSQSLSLLSSSLGSSWVDISKIIPKHSFRAHSWGEGTKLSADKLNLQFVQIKTDLWQSQDMHSVGGVHR